MIKHISPSSLGSFVRCAEQWRRRYIEKEIIPPGIAAHRGSGVHKAAEMNHVQKIVSWEDLPLTVLTDAARDGVMNSIKEKDLMVDDDDSRATGVIVAEGIDSAVTLTRLYHKEVAPGIQPVLAEEKVTMDIGLEVPLLGYIDCLTAEGIVDDLKTSNRAKNQNEVDTSPQLTAYAGMVKARMGFWPKVQLDVLVNSKVAKHQRLTSDRGQRDFDILISRIALMMDTVRAGIFQPCDPTAWNCNPKWCGYYHTCKFALGVK